MIRISKLFKGIVIVTAIICGAVLLLPDGSYARRYKVLGDRDLYVTGFVRQNADLGMHTPVWTGTTDLGVLSPLYAGYSTYPTQMSGHDSNCMEMLNTVYLETRLMWSDKLEFRFSGRFESDLIDHFHDNNVTWNNGSGQAFNIFQDANDLESDDEINDMIRELTVAYFGKYFTFRLGKQQLAWGQADGLRLMDQICALDLRRNFIMRDSDEGYWESRIPLWMARLDLIPDYNFGSQLGFQNLDLELSWIPDVHQANRFGIGPREGGPWGFPGPDFPLPYKQVNLPEDYPYQNLDNTTFAARLKGMFHGTFFTINYYYGWQKNFVLSNNRKPVQQIVDMSQLAQGKNPLVGTQIGTVGLLIDGMTPGWTGHGNFGDSDPLGPLANYLATAGTFPPGTLEAALAGIYGIPVDMMQINGGVSVGWYKKLERKKFIGFTLSRELNCLRPLARLMRQITQPVLRIEAMYDMDVPFNVGSEHIDKPGDPPNAALFSQDWVWKGTIVHRDIYRYLIGLDWNTHCKYINPNDDVFVSLQFSQNIMDGNVDVPGLSPGAPTTADNGQPVGLPGLNVIAPGGYPQRLCYAPYNWYPERIETFASVLVSSEYWHQNLKPQILYVYDDTYDSFWIKSKVTYKFHDNWRFEAGYTMIHGNTNRQFGLFDQSDYAWGSVKFQF